MDGTTTFLGKQYQIIIWTGQKLQGFISFDTETTLIDFNDREKIPSVIIGQAYAGGDSVYIIDPLHIKRFFNLHTQSTFIMHNAAFDMGVIRGSIGDEMFFDIYDENRLHDTSILYRLLHLAIEGETPFKYNLSLLSKIFLGSELDKNEEIRLTFEQFFGKPVSTIPMSHLAYGAIDAIATNMVYYKMLPYIKQHDKMGTLLSHDIQIKGEIALKDIEKNGIGFDLTSRDTWLVKQDIDLRNLTEKLSNWGWVRGVKGNSKTFERVLEFLKVKDQLPLTETGDVSTKSADLEPFRFHEFVDDYLKFMEIEKATSFVRDIDSDRVHSRYTSILNTGRTSCSKPNVQQLPRVGGIRELFVPKSGNVFLDIDYAAIELSTLSQVLLDKYDFSVMADKVNDGIDLHRYYASVLFNKTEASVTKDERQKAKAANFGFPGGLGIQTFKEFSRGYGLQLTDAEAVDMKAAWFEAFPEMRQYLKECEEGTVYTLTGRARGNTTYCAVANTPFQGLASDGLKLALYNIFKKGFKIVAEVHDQIMVEVKNTGAEESLREVEKIMIDSMKSVVPDVKISVEGKIATKWEK